ncbi:MAG: hypothetical protein AAB036_02240 [Elusimicrobiota bacterium]
MKEVDPNEESLLRLIEDGVSESANSLAAVSRTNWTTQTVSINADGVGSIRTRMMSDTKSYYGSYVTMPGAAFLMMVPQDRGAALAKAFLGERSVRTGTTVPRESECISEISNVVVHAIVNSLANACKESFFLSAPQMVLDKKSNLLTIALDKLQNTGESYAVMAYVHLSSDKLSSDCTVLLFLSPSFHDRLIQALA